MPSSFRSRILLSRPRVNPRLTTSGVGPSTLRLNGTRYRTALSGTSESVPFFKSAFARPACQIFEASILTSTQEFGASGDAPFTTGSLVAEAAARDRAVDKGYGVPWRSF